MVAKTEIGYCDRQPSSAAPRDPHSTIPALEDLAERFHVVSCGQRSAAVKNGAQIQAKKPTSGLPAALPTVRNLQRPGEKTISRATARVIPVQGKEGREAGGQRELFNNLELKKGIKRGWKVGQAAGERRTSAQGGKAERPTQKESVTREP